MDFNEFTMKEPIDGTNPEWLHNHFLVDLTYWSCSVTWSFKDCFCITRIKSYQIVKFVLKHWFNFAFIAYLYFLYGKWMLSTFVIFHIHKNYYLFYVHYWSNGSPGDNLGFCMFPINIKKNNILKIAPMDPFSVSTLTFCEIDAK